MKRKPITQKEQIIEHGRLIGILRKELKELKVKYDSLDKRFKYQEEKMVVLLKWRMTVVEDIENLLILLHDKQKYQKEYSKKNREYLKKYNQRYYQLNKKEIIEHSREYYQEHKEQMKKRSREYKKLHREQAKQQAKGYREIHKKQYSEYQVQ